MKQLGKIISQTSPRNVLDHLTYRETKSCSSQPRIRCYRLRSNCRIEPSNIWQYYSKNKYSSKILLLELFVVNTRKRIRLLCTRLTGICVYSGKKRWIDVRFRASIHACQTLRLK